MDSNKDKISQFISSTGADSNTAKEFLQEAKWNVSDAVKAYKFFQVSALPPPGPQKNVENQGSAVISAAESKERRLKRGISKSVDNAHIVSKAREIVLKDIVEDDSEGEHLQHLLDTSEYSFILPDITHFPEDFKAFLHKDLIETSTLVSLEQAGRLNWWADLGICQRLLPLATTGDGNCLLHAASLGMWGFHDRLLTLRKALHSTLTNSSGCGPLWRRWRWQQMQANKQSGLILSEEEWKDEWNYLLKQSSTKPRSTAGTATSCCDSAATRGVMERTFEKEVVDQTEVFYESLEEFHVFILANVLRRPIIIVSDTILKDQDGEALAPIPFGGLYLPFECKPSECHRSPLLLTYDAAHFSSIVTMESDNKEIREHALPAAIPLIDPGFELLTIHFMIDPGPSFVWNKDEQDVQKCKSLELSTDQKLNLIKHYLDIITLPIARARSTENGEDMDDCLRRRSRSFSGSLKDQTESESNGDGNSVKEKSNTLDGKSKVSLKDFKDKEKAGKTGKMDKKMQNVAKSFGSIGRSMSKKFKKMGAIGKNTNAKDDEYDHKVGSATQSTKVLSQAEIAHSRDQVLCARLQIKRLEYQDRMVENYMDTAKKRFLHDRELKKKQDEEMKKKVEEKRLSGLEQQEKQNVHQIQAPLSKPEVVEMECINKDCQGKGGADTCYLCHECFDQQKGDKTVKHNGGDSNKTVEVHHSRSHDRLDGIPRQNTLIDVGQSKFYTYFDEEQIAVTNESSLFPNTNNSSLNNVPVTSIDSSELNNVKNIRRDNKGRHHGAAVELCNSSFYDESLSDSQYSNIRTSHPANRHVPHGTAFVNNLHNEWKENGGYSKQDKYIKAAPLAKEYTNQIAVQTQSVSPTRRNAFKIRDSDVSPTEYEKQLNEVIGDLNIKGTKYTNISEKNEVLSQRNSLQQPCREDGCKYFGTIATDFYCSACFKQKQKTLVYKSHVQGKP